VSKINAALFDLVRDDKRFRAGVQEIEQLNKQSRTVREASQGSAKPPSSRSPKAVRRFTPSEATIVPPWGNPVTDPDDPLNSKRDKAYVDPLLGLHDLHVNTDGAASDHTFASFSGQFSPPMDLQFARLNFSVGVNGKYHASAGVHSAHSHGNVTYDVWEFPPPFMSGTVIASWGGDLWSDDVNSGEVHDDPIPFDTWQPPGNPPLFTMLSANIYVIVVNSNLFCDSTGGGWFGAEASAHMHIDVPSMTIEF
jgi:hypothetical protein